MKKVLKPLMLSLIVLAILSITSCSNSKTATKKGTSLHQLSTISLFGNEGFSDENTIVRGIFKVGDYLYVYSVENNQNFVSVGKNNRWIVKNKLLPLDKYFATDVLFSGNLAYTTGSKSIDPHCTVYIIDTNGNISKKMAAPYGEYENIKSTKGYGFMYKSIDSLDAQTAHIWFPQTGENIDVKLPPSLDVSRGEGYYDARINEFYFVDAFEGLRAFNVATGQPLVDRQNNGKKVEAGVSFGDLTVNERGDIYYITGKIFNGITLVKVDKNLNKIASVYLNGLNKYVNAGTINLHLFANQNQVDMYFYELYKNKASIFTFSMTK